MNARARASTGFLENLDEHVNATGNLATFEGQRATGIFVHSDVDASVSTSTSVMLSLFDHTDAPRPLHRPRGLSIYRPLRDTA